MVDFFYFSIQYASHFFHVYFFSPVQCNFYWKYMYCYFNNSHLLQYIAIILNLLIKQLYNRVIDEQSCLVHLQKYACVVLLILDTNVLIMCDSVYFFDDLNESWKFCKNAC